MLPSQLRSVKNRLETKPASRRTPGEDALLRELVHLDKVLTEAELKGLSIHIDDDGTFRVCQCCGKTVSSLHSRSAVTSSSAQACQCCGQ